MHEFTQVIDGLPQLSNLEGKLISNTCLVLDDNDDIFIARLAQGNEYSLAWVYTDGAETVILENIIAWVYEG